MSASRGISSGWRRQLDINDSLVHPLLVFRLKSAIGKSYLSLKSIFTFLIADKASAYIFAIKNPTIVGTALTYSTTENNSSILEVASPTIATSINVTPPVNIQFVGFSPKRTDRSAPTPFYPNSLIDLNQGDSLAIAVQILDGNGLWFLTTNFEEHRGY